MVWKINAPCPLPSRRREPPSPRLIQATCRIRTLVTAKKRDQRGDKIRLHGEYVFLRSDCPCHVCSR